MQLHALAEVELELSTHLKRLSDIEAKVILNLHQLLCLFKISVNVIIILIKLSFSY